MIIGIMHRYSIILSAMKRTLEIAMATAFTVIVNVISTIILVMNFGLIGAAWATLISSFVWLIMIRIYLINIKIPKFPWKILTNVCICIFFASLSVKYVFQYLNQDPKSLLLILFYTLLYFTIFYLMRIIINRVENFKYFRL